MKNCFFVGTLRETECYNKEFFLQLDGHHDLKAEVLSELAGSFLLLLN